MTLAAPERLLLLVAVAALVAGYLWRQRTRAAYALRFSALPLLASVAPRRPGWRRHVPAGALLAALTLLVLAVARPALEVQVPRERATVVVAIDTSISMEAVDVEPSRIAAAKAAAERFIAELPPRVNVGLVAFSGTASVVTLPTTDHAAVRRAVRALELGRGTAIGEAVFASLAALESLPPGESADERAPARVVLMSDGTTTVGRPDEAGIAAAQEARVPVSTIAYGTQAGTVTIEGQVVPVPVDRPALERIAEATGGTAFTAESGEELEDVYEDIGSAIGYTTEQREVTVWLAGLALLAGVVAAALALLWSPRLP